MRWLTMTFLALACAFTVSCGGEDRLASFTEVEEPVGERVLPDLMPAPQLNLLTKRIKGKWHIRFTTVIVNVGEGDFLLRGAREEGGLWSAEQLIQHTESGAEVVPLEAALAWGGDGHEHWHVIRVASVWMVPLDEQGRPASDDRSRIDTKVGFCFYDHTHELDRGPEKGVYSARTCGHEDDTVIGMGLSPGWNDTYLMTLPGQYIDVHDLPDGKYRVWTEIDQNAWFHEASRENNRTWIDVDLYTQGKTRYALVIAKGPKPV